MLDKDISKLTTDVEYTMSEMLDQVELMCSRHLRLTNPNPDSGRIPIYSNSDLKPVVEVIEDMLQRLESHTPPWAHKMNNHLNVVSDADVKLEKLRSQNKDSSLDEEIQERVCGSNGFHVLSPDPKETTREELPSSDNNSEELFETDTDQYSDSQENSCEISSEGGYVEDTHHLEDTSHENDLKQLVIKQQQSENEIVSQASGKSSCERASDSGCADHQNLQSPKNYKIDIHEVSGTEGEIDVKIPTLKVIASRVLKQYCSEMINARDILMPHNYTDSSQNTCIKENETQEEIQRPTAKQNGSMEDIMQPFTVQQNVCTPDFIEPYTALQNGFTGKALQPLVYRTGLQNGCTTDVIQPLTVKHNGCTMDAVQPCTAQQNGSTTDAIQPLAAQQDGNTTDVTQSLSAQQDVCTTDTVQQHTACQEESTADVILQPTAKRKGITSDAIYPLTAHYDESTADVEILLTAHQIKKTADAALNAQQNGFTRYVVQPRTAQQNGSTTDSGKSITAQQNKSTTNVVTSLTAQETGSRTEAMQPHIAQQNESTVDVVIPLTVQPIGSTTDAIQSITAQQNDFATDAAQPLTTQQNRSATYVVQPITAQQNDSTINVVQLLNAQQSIGTTDVVQVLTTRQNWSVRDAVQPLTTTENRSAIDTKQLVTAQKNASDVMQPINAQQDLCQTDAIAQSTPRQNEYTIDIIQSLTAPQNEYATSAIQQLSPPQNKNKSVAIEQLTAQQNGTTTTIIKPTTVQQMESTNDIIHRQTSQKSGRTDDIKPLTGQQNGHTIYVKQPFTFQQYRHTADVVKSLTNQQSGNRADVMQPLAAQWNGCKPTEETNCRSLDTATGSYNTINLKADLKQDSTVHKDELIQYCGKRSVDQEDEGPPKRVKLDIGDRLCHFFDARGNTDNIDLENDEEEGKLQNDFELKSPTYSQESLGFVTALEYHSSQNSESGFDVDTYIDKQIDTVAENLPSSEGTVSKERLYLAGEEDQSVPLPCSDRSNACSIQDLSMYAETPESAIQKTFPKDERKKVYLCDADLDEEPVQKREEGFAKESLSSLPRYSRDDDVVSCFKWKQTSSYDADAIVPDKALQIQPLPVCVTKKSLRIGLSKRQRTNSLHPHYKRHDV